MQRSWGQFIHADELESATRYQMNKFPLFRSGEGLRASRYEIREDGDYVDPALAHGGILRFCMPSSLDARSGQAVSKRGNFSNFSNLANFSHF